MSEPVALVLTINGVQVQGEGPGHGIECVYYRQAIDAPSQVGSGEGTGRPRYGPLVIRKRIDKASPLIAEALVQNSVVEAVFRFFGTQQDGTVAQFYTTRIRQARIASFSQYVPDVLEPATASQPPLEEVTFVYQAIEWTHSIGGVTHQDSWHGSNGAGNGGAAPAGAAAGAAPAGAAGASAGSPVGALAGAAPMASAGAAGGAAEGAAGASAGSPVGALAGAAPTASAGAAGGAAEGAAGSTLAGGGAGAATSVFSADQAVVAGPPSRVARIVPLTAGDTRSETRLRPTKNGTNGAPFSGTFSSPNGQFSLAVADTGITIAGPGNSIKLQPDGSIEVKAGRSLDLRAGGSAELDAGATLGLRAGGPAELDAGATLGLRAGGAGTLQAAGAFDLQAGRSLGLRAVGSAELVTGTSLDLRAGGTSTVQAGTSLDLSAGGTGTLQARGPLNLKGSVIRQN